MAARVYSYGLYSYGLYSYGGRYEAWLRASTKAHTYERARTDYAHARVLQRCLGDYIVMAYIVMAAEMPWGL